MKPDIVRLAVSIGARPRRGAATLLSILRRQGRSAEAVVVTEKFENSRNSALLTARAAALVDLGRPAEARKLLDRTWAIVSSRARERSDISLVYTRIESEFGGPF